MHQQLWGYKVEEKLHLGVREQKRLNTTGLDRSANTTPPPASSPQTNRPYITNSILTCHWFEAARAAMSLQGRGSGAMAVVPQHRPATVALHKAHGLAREAIHEKRKPGPHTADSAETHFVVPGRD